MNVSPPPPPPPPPATATQWLTHQATSSLASVISRQRSLIHVLHPAAIAAIILLLIYIAPRHLRVHLQLAIHTPPRREVRFTFFLHLLKGVGKKDAKCYRWYKQARLYIVILQGFILDYNEGSSG
ncbi:hypothetical protein BJ165DRAFT_1534619 [Panaeolus papilionaceus]|nr:hypothetical protein BJ165DRAFT_1534619 [Panaeolus papilionaceus]